MTRPETVAEEGGATDASTLFALLSDEIRVRIVRELGWAGEEGSAPLSFSDLRTRVGVADSGRFNYHLRRLRGTLVEKTERGYVLTPMGYRAAAAVGATA